MKRWFLASRLCLPVLAFVCLLTVDGFWSEFALSGDELPRLALHEGGLHELPGVGDADSGACPQPRNTEKAPDDIYNRKSPLSPTPENILAGKILFNFEARPTVCKLCHGFTGNGMGILFEKLFPRPRNFTCYYTMKDIPDGQMFWIIQNGSKGTKMPAFGYLADDQIWQLVLYIRHFIEEKNP